MWRPEATARRSARTAASAGPRCSTAVYRSGSARPIFSLIPTSWAARVRSGPTTTRSSSPGTRARRVVARRRGRERRRPHRAVAEHAVSPRPGCAVGHLRSYRGRGPRPRALAVPTSARDQLRGGRRQTGVYRVHDVRHVRVRDRRQERPRDHGAPGTRLAWPRASRQHRRDRSRRARESHRRRGVLRQAFGSTRARAGTDGPRGCGRARHAASPALVAAREQQPRRSPGGSPPHAPLQLDRVRRLSRSPQCTTAVPQAGRHPRLLLRARRRSRAGGQARQHPAARDAACGARARRAPARARAIRGPGRRPPHRPARDGRGPAAARQPRARRLAGAGHLRATRRSPSSTTTRGGTRSPAPRWCTRASASSAAPAPR